MAVKAFTSQVVYNSLLSIKLKNDLIILSADGSLKIIFKDSRFLSDRKLRIQRLGRLYNNNVPSIFSFIINGDIFVLWNFLEHSKKWQQFQQSLLVEAHFVLIQGAWLGDIWRNRDPPSLLCHLKQDFLPFLHPVSFSLLHALSVTVLPKIKAVLRTGTRGI